MIVERDLAAEEMPKQAAITASRSDVAAGCRYGEKVERAEAREEVRVARD